MARQLRASEQVKLLGRGPAPVYHWDQWMNGKQWLLRFGQDYGCTYESFYTYARKQAKVRGFKVVIHQTEDERGLVLQAIVPETLPPPDPYPERRSTVKRLLQDRTDKPNKRRSIVRDD